MPMLARKLESGERLILDVRPHWRALSGPMAGVLALLVLCAVAASSSAPKLLDWAIVLILALAVVRLVAKYVRWTRTSLVLTSRRVLRKSGVPARVGRDIPIARIRQAGFRRSLVDRIVGSGDLIVELRRPDGSETFSGIPHPELFQGELVRQLANTNVSGGTGGLDARLEALESLADMRRKGLITHSEFVARKRELTGQS